MLTGIGLGLGAASLQSLSYIFTRRFVTRYDNSAFPLLVMGHVIMGTLSLAALPLLWPRHMAAAAVDLVALALASVFYLVGAAALTVTLRSTQASRMAPLLGLKVFILALISVAFLGGHINAAQWGAVGMSITATLMLSQLGSSMTWRSLSGILIACVGYSISDINIRKLVLHFPGLGLAHATALGVCLIYLSCGIAALPAAFRYRRPRLWIDSVPYAASWFTGMFFLFGTFASIGVVYGNMVQSSRGIISIVLGALIARAGFITLEERATPGLTARRGAAALLMTAAIVVYYLGA